MFRFLMILILMMLSFFAGKLSAQEPLNFDVVYEQPLVSHSELLSLLRNSLLKAEFPQLHRQLLALLASAQVQEALVFKRADSPVYQQLLNLVQAINTQVL
jgi:hypothetical protein